MYDYLIVGAGLYAAVFAERAISSGKSVLVVEKRPHIGGNIFTENFLPNKANMQRNTLVSL